MLEEIFHSAASVSLFGVAVALLLLHLLYCNFSCGERRAPPGPRPLPLIGNLFQLDLKKLDESLFDLSKKYGSVFQVFLGPKKVVVLAGYRTVKEALVRHAEEFGNREINPLFYDLTKEHGISFSNGESWREMRRFALTTLKDFGMGRTMSEEKIIEECHQLIKEFEQFEGEAFDSSKLISYASSNIIAAIMFGKRFDYKDPDFQTMVKREHNIVHVMGSSSMHIYSVFPWLGPFLKQRRDLIKIMENSKEDLRKIINNLEKTLDPGTCRCFIDAFLIRKKHLKDSGNNNPLYHEENLLSSVFHLFNAGSGTTATTLNWCLLYMARFPHIQERVHEELSRVLGGRQVRANDRTVLPYTDAVIHESQRLANIVPFALPHATSTDVNFQGFFIKEGTTVFPLLTSVLYDETEWEQPRSFNPSHFFSEDGKFLRRDAFIPFSAGRRACLAEALANMELFLFFTSLLQHFHFTPPPGILQDDLDLKPVVGLTLTPTPQKLCAFFHH